MIARLGRGVVVVLLVEEVDHIEGLIIKPAMIKAITALGDHADQPVVVLNAPIGAGIDARLVPLKPSGMAADAVGVMQLLSSRYIGIEGLGNEE